MVFLFGKSKKKKPQEEKHHTKILSGPSGSGVSTVKKVQGKPPQLPTITVQHADSYQKTIATGEFSARVCVCCGKKVRIPSDQYKFKCSTCLVTNDIHIHDKGDVPLTNVTSQVCSVTRLKNITQKCFSEIRDRKLTDREDKYRAFEPIISYLENCFGSRSALNASFLPKNSDNFTLIDYPELFEFYRMVMDLPTRRPFFRVLTICKDLLKRPGDLTDDIRWLLIIWENPLIRDCLVTSPKYPNFGSPQIKEVAYEISEYCVAYLSHVLNLPRCKPVLYHLRKLDRGLFTSHVEKINLYITRLMSIKAENRRRASFPLSFSNENIPPNTLEPSTEVRSQLSANSGTNKNLTSNSLKRFRHPAEESIIFKRYTYDKDWRVITACILMGIYNKINAKRGGGTTSYYGNNSLKSASFYNVMLDFLDYRQDFDTWRGLGKENSLTRMLSVGSGTLDMMDSCSTLNDGRRFTFCDFPFLLSLGIKISIMEYETRRIMEYQAERAFLTSLDQGKMVDVYFKIRVRRKYISHDSLNAIRQHQGDLQKSLRIEFVDEPGVDAGGLRKEWFLMLTKGIFDPSNGLWDYIRESRFSWFSMQPVPGATMKHRSETELYYLFGVVIALAVFNGNILDLHFPTAFYKKMCGEALTFKDYAELFPETARGLSRLLAYPGDDFEDVFSLNFETTYRVRTNDNPHENGIPQGHDTVTVELIPNGSHISVTQENKRDFVNLWIDFYLNRSIKAQFDTFMNGVNRVFSSCDSIKLFNSEELQRLLCGDESESKYDFQVLRSATKYQGGFSDRSPVVEWFWKIAENWDSKLQGKLLQFVTGSNRIPAMGISALPFKISRLGPEDNEKLPIAHTCFNELCLWTYSSEKKLEEKLLLAVTESEGFGFR